jgi:protease I
MSFYRQKGCLSYSIRLSLIDYKILKPYPKADVISLQLKFNNMATLSNHKVAILTEEGFEQVELTSPKAALEEAGAEVDVISPKKGKIKAWDHTNWGITIDVDKALDDVSPDDYDALMLPGGVLNPDKLRQNNEAVAFVASFLEEGKPVAAICHGPQMLIETDMIYGRRLTSYPSLQTDLKNAGADWVDEEVVVDNGLVTSRRPDDLEAFNKKMIEEIAEGIHERG